MEDEASLLHRLQGEDFGPRPGTSLEQPAVQLEETLLPAKLYKGVFPKGGGSLSEKQRPNS